MDRLFFLVLVGTAVEMTVCFLCARNLWRKRAEAKDNSRLLLGLGALICGLLSLFSLLGNLGQPVTEVSTITILQPWVGLVFLSMHIFMTLYPIMVVRPDWLTPRRSFFLYLPVILFAVSFLFFIGRWTPLSSPGDLWDNILKPDVLLRVASQLAMIPYCLILLLLPYNYHNSSADHWWIVNYTFGLIFLCVAHIGIMVTFSPVLLAIIPFLAAVFYLLSTAYERGERLLPRALEKAFLEADAAKKASAGATSAQTTSAADAAVAPEAVPEGVPAEFGLWTRICQMMDQEEVWRDPDLSLTSMAHRCATNVTYLNRIIKLETGSGFKELVTTKRISSVAAKLQENPDVDIQDAFFDAGFRSRTTAWRNFKDIMGVTPTEFRHKRS